MGEPVTSRGWGRPALREFRRFFDALPSAVLAVRCDVPRFTIVAASNAYLNATLTTRDGPSGIIGRPLFDAFPDPPEDSAATGVRDLRESLTRAIATGTSDTMHFQRHHIRRQDGTWEERFWSRTNVPVRDRRGGVGYVLHRIEDVTDVMRLDRRASSAERARAVAQEANEAKAAFLASMSHELRTPLNAIAGYVELLKLGVHGPINDDQLNALDRIHRSEQHLLGLINEVLAYAKIESGHLDLNLEHIRLGDVLDDVITLTAPQAEARGLRIVAHATQVEGCEIEVFADGEKTRQILINLVSNAVKFSRPPGAVTIECGNDGERVVVRVIDTGIGIADEEAALIFEPFIQAGRGTPIKDGAGLGLSISRSLARAMGGDVTVTSHLGDGSVFTLTLPRRERREQRQRRSA